MHTQIKNKLKKNNNKRKKELEPGFGWSLSMASSPCRGVGDPVLHQVAHADMLKATSTIPPEREVHFPTGITTEYCSTRPST